MWLLAEEAVGESVEAAASDPREIGVARSLDAGESAGARRGRRAQKSRKTEPCQREIDFDR